MKKNHYWQQVIREEKRAVSASLVALLLVGAIWFDWSRYGDPLLVNEQDLMITSGLVALNLGLAFWTLSREPFASYLLIGATILGELFIMYFLYQV